MAPGVATADCIGDNVGPLCDRADVNQDSTVNVTDLLAVIDAWGAYTPWADVPLGGYCDGSNPACGPGLCHYNDVSPSPATVEPADIAKPGGLWPDGVVNVTDLLAILNNWGTCTEKDGVDQTTQDCMDYATYELELEPYSVEWLEAVETCLKSSYNIP